LTLDKITSALALSYLAQSYALRLKDLILDHERNAYVWTQQIEKSTFKNPDEYLT